MESKTQQYSAPATSTDAIAICDLEYDVAGVGATEPSNAEENQAAYFLVSYRTPEQK